jgi:hypothetical protein
METTTGNTADGLHCQQCNTTYKTRSGLWEHNLSKHGTQMTVNAGERLGNDCEKLPVQPVIKCEYCQKIFTRRNNLNWHLKNICKEKIRKEQREDLYKQEINELKKEINDIKNKYSNKTINNINNGINITNNDNRKFIIYKPGIENIFKLTDEENREIFAMHVGIIIKFIEHNNFNERLPEHHAYCTTDLKGQYLQVYDNDTNTVCKLRKKYFLMN